jgi:hypothetical protein|tara:strand:+ start:113 stop:373 length:261 start_codon:yes stop_codon:yes gene_type:complete
MIFSLYYKEIITMKNIKKIGVSILAAIGLISIITGTTLQERQIGKYQIDCEFTSETSRTHCVTLDTETGDIFATLKIKKSDFELRN